MEITVVGLGRMGTNIVRRLVRAGHKCLVYDINPKSVAPTRRRGCGWLRIFEGAGDQADTAARGADAAAGRIADRLMSAMRHEFGGHAEKTAAE